jgi:sulfur transfer protein SufE/stress-induced morphogen
MKLSLAYSLSLPICAAAFVPAKTGRGQIPCVFAASEQTSESLGLTEELAKITGAFETIGDDKLRYKQLLFMANQLAPMDASSMTPENKVPGCLSTVYVDGTLEEKDGRKVIHFTGDSDGLLTKGLVALLVRGLSGNTAEDIEKVDPAFIKKAGISTSLTPGRNNGFLNMLASMKRKAVGIASSSTPSVVVDSSSESLQSDSDTPMYDAMVAILEKLQPTALTLKDVSYKHAGHAAMKGIEGGESHFDLEITADAFEGLNLVKRHKLVYMMLGEVMPKIHALSIKAQTPAEADTQ